MKKMINFTTIEGILYQHNLELKVSGENSKNPGTEYITGTIEIATDNAGLNIVPVHYTYVTATTSKGNTNRNFAILKNIIDGIYGTKMKDGEEAAVKLHVDSAIGLNEFYSDRNGQEELVSVKRNEGGFINVIDSVNADEKLRNSFKTDMVITEVRHIEADPDKDLPEKAIVSGYIFDFRNALLPVSYVAYADAAINYFESLDASKKNPVFHCVWGHQISTTTVRRIVEESAFGEDSVREVTSSRKDFVITGAASSPYDWDDEGTITAQEFMKANSDREITLATMKKNQEEYRARKNNVAAPSKDDDFNF